MLVLREEQVCDAPAIGLTVVQPWIDQAALLGLVRSGTAGLGAWFAMSKGESRPAGASTARTGVSDPP